MLSSLLNKEYRCNTGVALTTKEAEELLAILHQIYQEILTQGGMKPRTANRLTSLQEEISRRGANSSSCSRAASELAQLVTTTTKEALTEKQEYETALRQREARIQQCRKVALAGEQSNKAAAEVARKQEAIELQKAEEQKLKAEMDRKRQQEDLERQEKEAQKEQQLKAEAEALELHKKTLALQKEREEQLKAEAEAHKRQTEELERKQKELRNKIEQQRQLEAEKERQKERQRELERQVQADQERKVKQERESQVESAQGSQKESQDRITIEKEQQAKIKSEMEQAKIALQEEQRQKLVAEQQRVLAEEQARQRQQAELEAKKQAEERARQRRQSDEQAELEARKRDEKITSGQGISGITWSEVHRKFIEIDTHLTTAQKEKLEKDRRQWWQQDYRGKWVRWRGSVKNVLAGGSTVKIDMGKGSWGADIELNVAPDSRERAIGLNANSPVTFVGRMSEQPGGLLAMDLLEVTIE